MILFCLPYAGGSKAIYYKWGRNPKCMPKIAALELKGRGERYDEDFSETIEDAVDDILLQIKDKIVDEDYAIYGHSMGSILAYELYYKIKESNYKEPKHIFFSGQKSPDCIRKEKISHLPDYDFMQKVVDLGGTPQEIMENKELVDYFLPVMRSDFKILEDYVFKKKDERIQCNISIFNGKSDDIKLEEILAWRNHAGSSFKVYDFEGDHFFINTNETNIINRINDILSNNG